LKRSTDEFRFSVAGKEWSMECLTNPIQNIRMFKLS